MGTRDRGITLTHLNTLFSVGMIGGLTDCAVARAVHVPTR